MLRSRHLLLAALFAISLAAPAQADTQELRGISVNGEASREVANDAAFVHLGATARRASAKQALRASSATMRKVLAGLRGLGIARRDVQTHDVGVRRVFERDPKTRRRLLVGFAATSSATATVRDVKKVGPVIDSAVDAGATSVRGPHFFVSQTDAIYLDLLGEAFADARAKAERLAAAAGLTLGPAQLIDESDDYESDFLSDEFDGGGGRLRSEAPIRPGTSSISASVTVLFETS